jgi:hypothetical protein
MPASIPSPSEAYNLRGELRNKTADALEKVCIAQLVNGNDDKRVVVGEQDGETRRKTYGEWTLDAIEEVRGRLKDKGWNTQLWVELLSHRHSTFEGGTYYHHITLLITPAEATVTGKILPKDQVKK